jgi:hypothetical protein
MSLQQFIKNLQNKPYEVRTRILWTTTAVATVIVVGVWILGLKQEFGNLDKQSILGSETEVSELSAQHYTQVESIEKLDGKLLVYFSVNNDTNDILNFSKASDIKLVMDGEEHTPSKLTDRQNQNFVLKILSHTQNFGILTFDTETFRSGALTFDTLFFENNIQKIFKEQINLDPSKLTKPKAIRE